MNVALLTAGLAGLVGAGYLGAWLGGHMAGQGASAVTMKTNAALCLLLLGISMVLLVPGAPGKVRRRAGRVGAAVALVIGALTLSENLLGWDLGIDQLLAREPPGALGVVHPNRLGTPASLSITLLGTALLLMSRRRGWGVAAAQGLALTVCLIGLLPTIGYLCRAQPLYGIARFTAIAWPTALALQALGIGLLCARPDRGLMAQIMADDPGGAIMRRLLLPAILLPIVLAWLRQWGKEAGLYDTGTGRSLLVLSSVLVFSLLAYAAGRRVSKVAAALEAATLAAEQARLAAEEASRAKDHFLATLSHELRTPLTPVLTTATMLANAGQLPAEVREDLEVIRRNVELEARLIDDLLDVTRITRGKLALHCKPVLLADVIAAAVEVCRDDIRTRRLQFGVDLGEAASCVVHADAARLQQAFWNLIKNAVKFTPPGGMVHIGARRESRRHLVVEVTDNGEGIDPGVLPHLFRPFEQGGRETTRQFGGLGLGLAITRGLVEMHGGTVTAHSEGKGQGTTIRVRLPYIESAVGMAAAPATQSAPPALPPVATPAQRLQILLVEDHRDTMRIMQRVLAGDGHEVYTAGNVAAALETCSQRSVHLIISDLGLPDGSGTDLIRTLRQQGRFVPAIALSGYGQAEDIRRSREAGFDDHLTKPVDLARLKQVIYRLGQQTR